MKLYLAWHMLKLQASQDRLLFVDGLRGVAAMAVVCYHFFGHLKDVFVLWMPQFVQVVRSHGYLGVPVFFVISGVVITRNVGVESVRGTFLPRFALRRSIRLDPPYWLAIAVSVALAVVAETLFQDIEKSHPSPQWVLAHLFYLQNILGYGDIVSVFWTLCFEVQFYMFLVLILLVGQWLTRSESSAGLLRSHIFLLVWLGLVTVSVLDFVDAAPWEIRGIFLPYWYAFALGAVTTWSLQRRVPLRFWFACVFAVAMGLAANLHAPTIAITIISASALLFAGLTNRMSIWLANPLAQFMGRISYSLYLFHAIVGWSSVSLFKRLWPYELGVSGSVTAFMFGTLISIATAWFVYLSVEKPSMALSRRVPLRPQ